tara:strand:- start:133 stop:447 length:315 start_codon:yes stop_codon:yes gene_type:complete
VSIEAQITEKISTAIKPIHLEVINESHMHNVPKDSESHFKLLVVAEDFQSQNRVQRHRTINGLLAEELNGPVHALSMHLFSPQEWQQAQDKEWASPQCRGGSKS